MLWVSPVELSRNPGVTHMQVKGNVRQTRDVHREKLLIAILLPSYNAPLLIHDSPVQVSDASKASYPSWCLVKKIISAFFSV